ncbi:hypothetical protein ROLI_022670 [Roseobacter fucihabitans]|uniref:Uncharacterized protein n=1 Tax=Roseobacter fucihabitans TaxID=1537242 RepID=A0ABZ2BVF8_9RHOB|nr:hypothetical protein [Roseobacter litoralis]MBC6967458.1 hypothetical protein [Roseobacter litoralis]
MIGVVLWSDVSDRKAVIWCEDQGDLAFLTSKDDIFAADAFFDAGDVVQFEMEIHQTMRRARNPRLVVERAGAGLPEALREQAHYVDAPTRTAQIIPFRARVDDKARDDIQIASKA